MKSLIVLVPLLAGSGLLFSPLFPTEESIQLPSVPLQSEDQRGEEQSLFVHPDSEAKPTKTEQKEEKERVLPSAGDQNNTDEASLNRTVALQNIPWGYRFVPGQKLWYEWEVDRTDLGNGNAFVATFISTFQAVIEIESVDDQGNITLLLTTEEVSKKWKTKEANEYFINKHKPEAKKTIRATITSLGAFIDGEVLNDPEEEEWLEMTNRPDFGGSRYPLPSEQARFHVERWIPEWPARESFNEHFYFESREETFDTLHPRSLDLYNDVSRHLDTIDNAILYVSAKARNIKGDNPVAKSREENERWERMVVPDKIGQTREQAYAEQQYLNGLQTDQAIRFGQEKHLYALDSSSIASNVEIVRLDNRARSDYRNTNEKESPNYMFQGLREQQLSFRKEDGALVKARISGSSRLYPQSADSRYNSNMRLLRSEVPEDVEREISTAPSLK